MLRPQFQEAGHTLAINDFSTEAGPSSLSWVNNHERWFSIRGHIQLPTSRVHRNGVRILSGIECLENTVSSAVDHCKVVAMRVGDIDPISFRVDRDRLGTQSHLHRRDHRASCAVNYS